MLIQLDKLWINSDYITSVNPALSGSMIFVRDCLSAQNSLSPDAVVHQLHTQGGKLMIQFMDLFKGPVWIDPTAVNLVQDARFLDDNEQPCTQITGDGIMVQVKETKEQVAQILNHVLQEAK